jgi:hypothetical protein
MQWASSMTTMPVAASNVGSRAAKRGLPSRSGDTSSTSKVPASTWASTSSHSSMLVELMVAALSPARDAAAT